MTDTLSASGLHRGFGDVTVLDGVDLTLERGEIACLVGPNGSGKTTLLRTLAGLLEPDSGTVSHPDTDGRAVGYLPQSPAFSPSFTVLETVEFFASLVEQDVDVDDRLSTVGLDPVVDRPVGDLSGGMVRLLGLTQATIGEPPVLVLDEPASGLDPQMSRHIADAVTEIADTGTGVLLATHDLVAVERIADTVHVLDRGSFVASGSLAAVRGDAPSLEEALDGLITRDDAVAVRAGGVRDE